MGRENDERERIRDYCERMRDKEKTDGGWRE